MRGSFSVDLIQFALSVDIVDENIMDQIKKIIKDFFQKKLNIYFFELLVEQVVSNKEGIATEWASYPEKASNQIYINYENKEFYGQASFAFVQQKPMWLHSTELSLNAPGAKYLDLWSEIQSEIIPKYIHYQKNKKNPKTSILIPLKNSQNKIYGVINLESEEKLEPSEYVKKELLNICDAYTMLRELYNSNKSRDQNTKTAIDSLRRIAQDNMILKKPTIFLASSENADTEVMGVIIETIRKYESKLELRYWKELNNSGNINARILQVISQSAFGVCYFSEKSSEENSIYKDNSNVVFEAGMLHALTNNDIAYSPESWIPIREKDSTDMPFDFAAERIIVLRRDKNGKLNKDRLESELKDRLKEITRHM